MKKFFLYIVAAAIGAASGPAIAADVTNYPAGAAANGIAGTRHNMGSLGWVIRGMETTEICVFCHTPHHSNKGGANGLAPLWNKGTSAPTSFTAYGTTLGNTSILNTDIGGATLACLSCHDGVTTFDNIVNAPGKGGVVNGGSDRGWKFAMPLANEWAWTPQTWFHNFNTSVGACTACHKLDQIERLTIGLDLSNDHPVSVAYNTDRASLRATDTVINSIDLTSELASSARVVLEQQPRPEPLGRQRFHLRFRPDIRPSQERQGRVLLVPRPSLRQLELGRSRIDLGK